MLEATMPAIKKSFSLALKDAGVEIKNNQEASLLDESDDQVGLLGEQVLVEKIEGHIKSLRKFKLERLNMVQQLREAVFFIDLA